MRVTETRGAPSGIRRRRACRNSLCNGRLTTMEVAVNFYDRLSGGMVMVPRERLRQMAALLADALQEQVGVST